MDAGVLRCRIEFSKHLTMLRISRAQSVTGSGGSPAAGRFGKAPPLLFRTGSSFSTELNHFRAKQPQTLLPDRSVARPAAIRRRETESVLLSRAEWFQRSRFATGGPSYDKQCRSH